MQPAHPWYRYNLATDAGILPCFTSCRRTLIQRKMRPVLVIVGDVFLHQTLQMSFVEDDHMVEQIASATPNPAFCDAILPRTSETRPRWLDTKAFHGTDHFSVKVDRSIEDQITGIEGYRAASSTPTSPPTNFDYDTELRHRLRRNRDNLV